jgi:hypothetical protein
MLIATSNAKRRVNAIKIGKANFLKTSLQHPITQDRTINKTDKIITTGVFTNML